MIKKIIIILTLILCFSFKTAEAETVLEGFYLTWYGQEAGNITAMGTTPQSYYTIAVDPYIIPLGSYCTVIFPTGETYECRAEDTGGAVQGYMIDMYVDGAQWYWDNVNNVTVIIH